MNEKKVLPMLSVEYLVLHCSSTRCNQNFTFDDLKRDYPHAKVVGHRDFPGVAKKCPCLEVSEVYGFLNDDLKNE